MDRREAVLRELNLYPQWVRRDQPAQVATDVGRALARHADPEPVEAVGLKPDLRPVVGAIHELPAQSGEMANVGAIDKTTSHSTRLSAEELLAGHPKDDSQVAGYHESPAQPGAMTTKRAIDETTDGTTSHLTNPAKDAGQVIGYSHSTRLSKNDNQVAGYHESPLPDWPELKRQVRDCTACRLRAGCTQTVFGVGDESADWLFVGEGPGADEDALGEPFVGQAGKLLDNMLMAIRLKRGENVYIANIVKCRPPGNRAPAADEIAQCLPYLQRQIELIQPKLIVALGKVASNALLGREASIASLRGKLHDYQLATATGLEGGHGDESSRLSPIPHQTTSSHRVRTTIPLIVTYHPAYLLRSPTEKAKAWQDLCLATDTMKKLQ